MKYETASYAPYRGRAQSKPLLLEDGNNQANTSHINLAIVQGDQLNMAVFFRKKNDLSSLRYTVHVYTGQVTFSKVTEKPGHV